MLEAAVVRALKRAKSDQVSISAFNAGHWDRMSQRLGVKMELCPSHQLAVEEGADASPLGDFQWTDTPEPNQVDRCVAAGIHSSGAITLVLSHQSLLGYPTHPTLTTQHDVLLKNGPYHYKSRTRKPPCRTHCFGG